MKEPENINKQLSIAEKKYKTLAEQISAITYIADVDEAGSVRYVSPQIEQILGFSPEDRSENIRRAGEVAALFCDAGLIVLAAFISPVAADRDRARMAVPKGRFCEVYLTTPLSVCESRDPKGLYKKARKGEVGEFTGISSPYEPPYAPELTLDTSTLSVDECIERILPFLDEHT